MWPAVTVAWELPALLIAWWLALLIFRRRITWRYFVFAPGLCVTAILVGFAVGTGTGRRDNSQPDVRDGFGEGFSVILWSIASVALVLATVMILLILTGIVELVYRRVAVRHGPSWALLRSLLAAGLAVAASVLLFVASPDAWFRGPGLFMILGVQACVVLAVVSLGRIARSRADEGAARLVDAGMGLSALAVVSLIAAIWLAVQVPPVPPADSGTSALSRSLHATAPDADGPPSTVVASRPCTPADLVWGPVDIDRAVGSEGLATVRVTSTSDVACYVEGFAGVTLAQGGNDLHVYFVESRGTTGLILPKRIGLARGDRAAFYVAWIGSGAAADQETSRTLWVSLGDSEPQPIRLGAAPFDLVDGGEVRLTEWFYVGPT